MSGRSVAEKTAAACARVYERLLCVYPRPFRDRYGREMAQVFRAAAADEARRGGTRALMPLMVRCALDLAVAASAERARALGAPVAQRAVVIGSQVVVSSQEVLAVQVGYRVVEPRLVERGMTVLGADGGKIGAVAHLHQPVGVGVGADVAQHTVVEVKTGLFGKGAPLYVPFTAVVNLTQGGLVLDVPSDTVDAAHPEWRTRPAQLPEQEAVRRSWASARPDDWYRLFK